MYVPFVVCITSLLRSIKCLTCRQKVKCVSESSGVKVLRYTEVPEHSVSGAQEWMYFVTFHARLINRQWLTHTAMLLRHQTGSQFDLLLEIWAHWWGVHMYSCLGAKKHLQSTSCKPHWIIPFNFNQFSASKKISCKEKQTKKFTFKFYLNL